MGLTQNDRVCAFIVMKNRLCVFNSFGGKIELYSSEEYDSVHVYQGPIIQETLSFNIQGRV